MTYINLGKHLSNDGDVVSLSILEKLWDLNVHQHGSVVIAEFLQHTVTHSRDLGVTNILEPSAVDTNAEALQLTVGGADRMDRRRQSNRWLHARENVLNEAIVPHMKSKPC